MIASARARVSPFVRRTPIISTRPGELGLSHGVALKLELLQYTGSFKVRGAFHKILTAAQRGIPEAGLVAASGGNHGAAVAFAARRLGHRAEIFVPSTSPLMKRDRIASFGAIVHVVDGLYDDAQAAANAHQFETGALLVHPYEDVDVVAGQGTMAAELGDQLDSYDTLLVATGGGGFTAGQAAWVRDTRKVVSVEPVTSQCLRAAVTAGELVDVTVSGVASDSLGARRLGAVAWSVVRHFVDQAVVVTDDDIRAAQRALWDELRLVAEPGGATALAALRCGAYVPERGERVVVVVCGSNCDPSTVTA
ncbi:MAG: pyridoxal-phosphate dependent enzyme [Actinobacteria bacterium]|nr:pyridoxal-phosphate dependent enzyme [Actinomycetota bacterium]